MRGSALMSPMLILLFGITPSTAISSDLVAAVLMRPVGAGVHMRARTVNFKLVGWMVLGSVPAAFLGAYLLHLMGGSKVDQEKIEIVLGTALLVGASAMVLRMALDRRSGNTRTAEGFIKDIFAEALHAEKVGLNSAWIGEHHFNLLGVNACPNILLAKLAGATQRIVIRFW